MIRKIYLPEDCPHVFVAKPGVAKALRRCRLCGVRFKDRPPPKWKHCVGHGWKNQSHDVKLICEEFLEWLSHNHPSVHKKEDRMAGAPIDKFYRARRRKGRRPSKLD